MPFHPEGWQPKFYFFDNGVTRALWGTLHDAPNLSEKGRLFEQWILQEVIRFNDYHQKDWKLSFWRTSHGAEVDLLVSRGPHLLHAVECKFSRQPSLSDLSGLRSFHDRYPLVPCWIVAPVDNPFRLDFAHVVSLPYLLSELKNEPHST